MRLLLRPQKFAVRMGTKNMWPNHRVAASQQAWQGNIEVDLILKMVEDPSEQLYLKEVTLEVLHMHARLNLNKAYRVRFAYRAARPADGGARGRGADCRWIAMVLWI